MQCIYDDLIHHLRGTEHLESASRLLGWDQQTFMPTGGLASRSEQMAMLAGLAHDRRTDPRVGDWLEQLNLRFQAEDPHSDVGANLRWIRRDYERLNRVPKALVEALTKSTVAGQQIWVQARQQNDFAVLLPKLTEIVQLVKEKADALGYKNERYDALLDEYEPLVKTSDIAGVLEELARRLKPLIEKAQASPTGLSNELLCGHYPTDKQREFNHFVAESIGFDFNRGRIDVAAHPFCEAIAPGDCRLTTRYDERSFCRSFFGTLHEVGHGMYEQGLDDGHFGEPLGQYTSLGIHESQSRLWENMVGRCFEFWQHFFPCAQQRFSPALVDSDATTLYRAVNQTKPSLIRVDADEATYNLHIVLRFELERAMMADELRPSELPGAWNEKYRHYLGIDPPTDADGVLQDIHWSAGLIGYFPTYALGNLYAAQLYHVAQRKIPDLRKQIAKGSFEALLSWLREHVHCHGRRYAAGELIKRVSGGPLDAEPLLAYLDAKLNDVYSCP